MHLLKALGTIFKQPSNLQYKNNYEIKNFHLKETATKSLAIKSGYLQFLKDKNENLFKSFLRRKRQQLLYHTKIAYAARLSKENFKELEEYLIKTSNLENIVRFFK